MSSSNESACYRYTEKVDVQLSASAIGAVSWGVRDAIATRVREVLDLACQDAEITVEWGAAMADIVTVEVAEGVSWHPIQTYIDELVQDTITDVLNATIAA